jgi:pimeloyl-ACP methyl ester carboxylesterase
VHIRPYLIHIEDTQLQDLRTRLSTTRWPQPLEGVGWDDGTDLNFLRKLASYWREGFDWRAQERRLNELPHFIATLEDEEIHFIHKQGTGPSPLPLILTHGWPGSFAEMEQIIPLLTDPGAHGADPVDAFDVVIPSLPGYGFSAAPSRPGVGSRRIAQLWNALMQGLGYSHFAAQGGDIGAGVSVWMARLFPDTLLGAHLNYIPGSYRPSLGAADTPVSPAEKAYLEQVAAWLSTEGGYGHMHSTKPQTLSYALTDSPIGLAAWIIEKFRSWSDCNGEIENAFTLDQLLTDISLYWFRGDTTASLRLYKEGRLDPLTFAAGERVTSPLGVALFPLELPTPPRSWVERVFNLRSWNHMPRGGHFAAMEQPQLLAEDIRAFFRPLRP